MHFCTLSGVFINLIIILYTYLGPRALLSILKQLVMASISLFEVRSCIRGYHIYKTVQYVDPGSYTRYVHTWPAGRGTLHARSHNVYKIS